MTGILLAIGWALSAVLSYVLYRWDFKRKGFTWTFRDRNICIFASMFGPLNFTYLVIVIGGWLLRKTSIDWDRPVRW